MPLTHVSTAAEPADVPPQALPNADDQTLLAAACTGDAAAFDLLVRQYAATCFSLARRVLRDEHMAQDAVQDAFLAAWHFLDRCEPDRTTPRSWLLMLTHHKAVDRVRMEERRRGPAVTSQWLEAIVDDAPSPDAVAWQRHRASQVQASLRRLPSAQLEVLVLCYFEGLTQREVAEFTDTPLGTVKTRALAGLRRLREDLVLAEATN